MGKPPTCPACGQAALYRHCPATNPNCAWDSCTSCKSNVNRVTGRHDHPIVDNCRTCGPITRARKFGTRS